MLPFSLRMLALSSSSSRELSAPELAIKVAIVIMIAKALIARSAVKFK